MATIKLKDVNHGYGIIGLMFKTKINSLYSFSLGSIDKSLHTFFCFSDMEAICINPYGMVLQKISMKPWKYYLCNKDTTKVIEGPVGVFDFIEVGDIVSF